MKKLMKEKVLPVPPTPDANTLLDIHDRFIQVFAMFRDKVCMECNYSCPTYYRKARGKEEKLSNAEREKYKDIEKECIRMLMQHAGMRVDHKSGEAA